MPFPLHRISQPVPLEHGLQAHTDELKLQTPVPLQLRGHRPEAATRVVGNSVNSVLPIASAASTLSMVRPDDFCMYDPPTLVVSARDSTCVTTCLSS